MSEGIQQSGPTEASANLSAHPIVFEYTVKILCGQFKSSVRLDAAAFVLQLKSIFGSITVTKVTAEMRQSATLGDNDHDAIASGHVYIGLIPTLKNTDVSCGTDSSVVNSVKNKQTFPLSAFEQTCRLYDFALDGFELDLAQDPRRGSGIVLWLGNSGVVANNKKSLLLATATFQIHVACQGPSVLW